MKNKPKSLSCDTCPGARWTLPFFLVLMLMSILSLVPGLRPSRSQMEKRDLAPFPEFSAQALVSGQYFDDITLWFSDTFPGREGWIQLSSSLESLHGHSEIQLAGGIPQDSDEIPPEEPVPQVSEVPADSTGSSPETTAPTGPDETLPQVPADTQEVKELKLGTVIQIGDTSYNYLGFSQIQSDRYAATLSKLADRLQDQGIRVVSAPAPTAVGIMLDKDRLQAMGCADQEAVIDYLHSSMSDLVIKADTFHSLADHNREYLYFRTDHHWTALGAYYSYQAICDALQMEPAPLESFEPWDQGEFQGSIYWKSPNPKKLKNDQLWAYIPQGDIVNLVCQNNGAGTERPLLRDMRDKNLNSKYLTFLWSDNPLCIVTNNSLPDAPDCILVKDSFGNCLAPFLTQNYHNIYAVDYRKYHAMTLAALAEKYQVRDIIFAPYLTATQSIDGNDYIATRCR